MLVLILIISSSISLLDIFFLIFLSHKIRDPCLPNFPEFLPHGRGAIFPQWCFPVAKPSSHERICSRLEGWRTVGMGRPIQQEKERNKGGQCCGGGTQAPLSRLWVAGAGSILRLDVGLRLDFLPVLW